MLGFVVVPLALAAGNWYAAVAGSRKLEYVFKPATLMAAIAWAVWLAAERPAGWGWLAPFFVAALVASLVGDVLLMLPDRNRFFLPGLMFFLLAHVCYVIGLNGTLPPLAALVLLIPVGILWVLLFRGIAAGLRRGADAGLLAAAATYSAALGLMLYSAWATWFRPEWNLTAQVLAIAGGTLFFVSDTMLAWNRFVRPWPQSHVQVMVTYHLGQFCLAAVVLFAP